MSVYAMIGKNGEVERLIEIDPANVIAFAARIERTLIPDDDRTAVEGGTWDGSKFIPPPPPPQEPAKELTALETLARLTPAELAKLKALLA